MYTTNVHLRGNAVGDLPKIERTQDHATTYGVTIGGPIIKDKLFFFLNGELEDNEDSRKHIFNVLYCAMMTYFNGK
jgi:hypothetical protein